MRILGRVNRRSSEVGFDFVERGIMEREELLYRQQQVLEYLNRLPRQILQMQGKDNVTEFVIHELCNESCFNLEKAAYLVDNPDFNCLKGVAGFSRSEAFTPENVWDVPQEFSSHMQSCDFNQKVRSFACESFLKKGETEEQVADVVAQTLGFNNYDYHLWGMKHDNHGLFLYQKARAKDSYADEYIPNGLCLLSFCPVF